MKAYDFQYDSKRLSDFGMVICNFGSKGLDTVSNGSEISFNTVSAFNGSKNYLTSVEYEDCLATKIQICKSSCGKDVKEITPVEFRQLTRWLNRKKFLKFKPLSEEYIDLYYEASFNVSRIELDGALYGLELEVITNRPFALKEPRTFVVRTRYLYTWEMFFVTEDGKKGISSGKYVRSYDRNSYPDDGIKDDGLSRHYYVYLDDKKKFENKYSFNDSSCEEGYIYPYVEITVDEDGDLNIHNSIEDRDTYIANCTAGEVITMDYPIIQSSVSSHKIQNDFNWNFFRVANTYDNGSNNLTVSLPCTIKIQYSPIIKVGL